MCNEGNRNNIKITNDENRLGQDDIKRMIREAKEFSEKDEERKRRAEKRVKDEF